MTSSVSPEANSGGEAPSFDTSVAHSARVYDYWLGGKDNFAADRVAGEQVIEVRPAIRTGREGEPRLPRPSRALPGQRSWQSAVPRHRHRPSVGNQHARGRPVRRARFAHRVRRQRPDRAGARPCAADEHARRRHGLARSATCAIRRWSWPRQPRRSISRSRSRSCYVLQPCTTFPAAMTRYGVVARRRDAACTSGSCLAISHPAGDIQTESGRPRSLAARNSASARLATCSGRRTGRHTCEEVTAWFKGDWEIRRAQA